MLCDECKKRPACVHITKITNNQKIEKHLCEECAKVSGEMNFSVDANFSVQDFLKGMFSHAFSGEVLQDEVTCGKCGLTYSDFSQNGKVGCSACYCTFGERLDPLLRRVHGASVHTGKLPKRAGGILESRQQLKRLRQELDKHVSREEYEEAAKMRDKIRQLEKDNSAQDEKD
ncbi:MAG TPA: UvrB/UvrC motif-containing protein [Negativicutes bacterium]|jgi:protein arginine kinase activator